MAAQPIDPAVMRRERVETLSRVEGVGRLLPTALDPRASDSRAGALRRRLEAVRSTAIRPDAQPAQLTAAQAELRSIETALIALLYETFPRGNTGITGAQYADSQRAVVAMFTAASRQAVEQSVGRMEVYSRRIGGALSDPNAFFSGMGMRLPQATLVPVAAGLGGSYTNTDLITAVPSRALRYAPTVVPPPARNESAELAALRGRLMRRGVSAQIIDTAIAEGRRQRVDPVLVLAVIEQESTWDRTAHNTGSGARGLMQLLPATAQDMGVRGAVSNPAMLFNVVTNIRAGTRYIHWIANTFFRMNLDLSDVTRLSRPQLDQILAAYNWGIGRVQTVVRRQGAEALRRVAPAETRGYMRQIYDRATGWLGSLWQ